MTQPAIGIAPSTPVPDALALLDRHRIKALPVVDAEGRLDGIVTRADLTQRAHGPAARRRRIFARLSRRIGGTPARVDTVMSRDVASVSQTLPLASLVPLFAQSGHHHIPVVDASYRLAGIVTQSDLITGLHRQAQRLEAA